MNNIHFKEGDLVMIRLSNDPDSDYRQRHYNTWFRVMFIDNDNTFVGRCERVEYSHEFKLYKLDQDVRFNIGNVLSIYKEGDQFCYGDGVTVCKCSGLCRNK
jgi:hypothetical protein